MKEIDVLKRWVKPRWVNDLCLLHPSNYHFLVEKTERVSIEKEINNRLKYLSFTKHYQHPDGIPRLGLNRLSKQRVMLIIQITGEDFRKETDVFQHKSLYLMKHQRLLVELNNKYVWYNSNMVIFGVHITHPDIYDSFHADMTPLLKQLRILTEQEGCSGCQYTDLIERSKILNEEFAKTIPLFKKVGPYLGN